MSNTDKILLPLVKELNKINMPIELKEALLLCTMSCLIAKEAELAEGGMVSSDIPENMLDNSMVLPADYPINDTEIKINN